MGACCFQFKVIQQPMPAFPHQSLPRQCMLSPSLNRPLHLDQGFERDLGNCTAFMALGRRQSTYLHPFYRHIWDFGTHTAFVALGRRQCMFLHPMPVFLRARTGQATAGSCFMRSGQPDPLSTRTPSSTANPRRRAWPGRMVACCHMFLLFFCFFYIKA